MNVLEKFVEAKKSVEGAFPTVPPEQRISIALELVKLAASLEMHYRPSRDLLNLSDGRK